MRGVNNIMSGLTQQRLGSNRIPQRVPAERRFVQRDPRNTSSTIQLGNSSHVAMKRIRIRRQAEEQRRQVEEQKRRAANIPLPKYVPPTTEEQTVKKAIPRRIVQSWIDRNLTPAIEKLCESHRKCNPGYEYVFYDDKECREFIEKHFHINVLHAYDAIIPGAFKADLFRYCELYINGGWWFDIDMMSVGSIDVAVAPEVEFACPKDILEGYSCKKTGDYALYQAILGAESGHKILLSSITHITRCVSLSPESWQAHTNHGVFSLTGPVMLGTVVNKWMGKKNTQAISYHADADVSRNIWIGRSIARGGDIIIGKKTIVIAHSQGGKFSQQSTHQEHIKNEYKNLRIRAGKCKGTEGGYNNKSYLRCHDIVFDSNGIPYVVKHNASTPHSLPLPQSADS